MSHPTGGATGYSLSCSLALACSRSRTLSVVQKEVLFNLHCAGCSRAAKEALFECGKDLLEGGAESPVRGRHRKSCSSPVQALLKPCSSLAQVLLKPSSSPAHVLLNLKCGTAVQGCYSFPFKLLSVLCYFRLFITFTSPYRVALHSPVVTDCCTHHSSALRSPSLVRLALTTRFFSVSLPLFLCLSLPLPLRASASLSLFLSQAVPLPLCVSPSAVSLPLCAALSLSPSLSPSFSR